MTETESEPATVTPLFVNPEFNMGDYVVDDLSNQVAAQAKQIAMLRAQNAQLLAQMRANADKIGLIVGENGSLSVDENPAPVRRSTAKPRSS